VATAQKFYYMQVARRPASAHQDRRLGDMRAATAQKFYYMQVARRPPLAHQD
jgi:hypothetical protein